MILEIMMWGFFSAWGWFGANYIKEQVWPPQTEEVAKDKKQDVKQPDVF
jgi:hypothetical protein